MTPTHPQEDLGFTASDLQWVVNAYAIAFGGLLLLGGRVAAIMRVWQWRDPDSNRGHHDFQMPLVAMFSGRKVLETSIITVSRRRGMDSRSLRSFGAR